jgi:hypothetical protein
MSHTSGVYGGKSEEFHLMEYECLRREIEVVLQDTRSLEKYIVVAIGAIWAWLHSIKTADWMWCIPCLFAILGAIRAFGINKSFGVFHMYILKLEEAYVKTGAPEGWEHFIEKHDTGYGKGSVLFWTLLILATIVVAIPGVRNIR